jgi:hypothetical protein
MAEKKEILEGAILDLKKIQEALNANTKEILRSVAKEEIDGVVKESLKEESDYEEEAVDDDGMESDETETDEPIEKDGDEPSDEIGDKGDVTIDDEPEAMDSDDDTEIPASAEVGPEDQEAGMDADAFGGDELDMTGASDDDVIAIYKKLSGDDEIEIVGDEIHLNISEPGEYIVKKGDLGMETSGEEDMEEMEDMDNEDEGLTYEIDMDEEPNEDDEEEEEDEEEDEEDESEIKEHMKGADHDEMKPTKKGNPKDNITETEEDESMTEAEEDEEDESITEVDQEDEDVVEEAIPVGNAQSRHKGGAGADIGQPKGAGAKFGQEYGAIKTESKSSTKSIVSEAEVKYKKLLNEATQLKNENEEFRKALKKFRSMLVETVVFNSNLSYVTKLFMEHSTTKDEKKKIIQRFDEEVTNLKESKKLYKTIANELGTRKPINEALGNKIIKEVTSSTSKQLNEANAYVDPSTQRIKDLIKRVENKDKY